MYECGAFGRCNGVRILTECLSSERFATSASEPGTLYRLTAYTCTCKGYVHAGRCQHQSLPLAELGWLPEVLRRVVARSRMIPRHASHSQQLPMCLSPCVKGMCITQLWMCGDERVVWTG